jgi:hypothetical protein
MSDFSIEFDVSALDKLDELALLAHQDYNLGGAGDWFGEFRGGLYGCQARLYGVERHYSDVHAWQPRVRLRTDIEYQLAAILFHLDSVLECFTFAINALGWAVMPSGFRDITDAKWLKRICPRDLLADPAKTPALSPNGYAHVFPTVQRIWQNQVQLINRIRDLHDISKHRTTVFVGGRCRLDPPAGFYEAAGISEEHKLATLLSPMAEIILKHDPKLPAIHRTPKTVQPGELLEDLVPSFAAFIKTSSEAALADAQAHVPLTEKQFRKS